jgi:hypothetical protein
MTHDERLAKVVEFNKQFVASRKAAQIATRDLIKTEALDPEEIAQLVEVYPAFEVGKAYAVGDILRYDGKLYKVVQAHTSQADWTPDKTPALFTPAIPVGTIAEWKQPTGAHDAYKIGDRVTCNGKTYESLIDVNTWSPATYPAGWKEI